MAQPTSKLRLTCPNCDKPLRIRTSRALNRVCREGIIECTDVEGCGWRGNFGLEIVSTLVPSQKPNPDVQIPLTRRAIQASTTQQ